MPAAFNMFEDLGLSCQIDAEGKIFPFTGKASSVVDVLRFAIEALNVQVFTNHKCINFNEDKSGHFEIDFEGDKSYFSKTLIVTAGSNLIKNSGKNIRFNEFKKVLGPIKTDTKHISNLDGIRVLAKVSICDRHSVVCSEEFGEILFRKYGVSGICIFNLSRFVKENEEQYISIDFSPETNVDELSKILKIFCKLLNFRRVNTFGIYFRILTNCFCDVWQKHSCHQSLWQNFSAMHVTDSFISALQNI